MTHVRFLEKGQVMILDLLLLLIIVILIISIEEKTITNYKLNILNSEQDLNLLKESLIVEQLISDCNYLAILNTDTKVCYKNKIEIKNINNLPPIICKISIDGIKYFDTGNIKNVHKRGIVYNNKFGLLEVGFCE
ncbi:MAG: hypothetical protein WCF78_02760 [archaeon]